MIDLANVPITLMPIKQYIKVREHRLSLVGKLLYRLTWSPGLGSRLLEDILLVRAYFPETAWLEFIGSHDIPFIRPYLKAIQSVILLPNDYFLPNDCFRAILLAADNGDCLGEQIYSKYENLTTVSNPLELFKRAIDQDWLLGDLIKGFLFKNSDQGNAAIQPSDSVGEREKKLSNERGE